MPPVSRISATSPLPAHECTVSSAPIFALTLSLLLLPHINYRYTFPTPFSPPRNAGLFRIQPLTSPQPQVTPPLTLSLFLSMISHAYQAWAPPPRHLPIILVASSTDIGCSGWRMKGTDGAPVSEIRTLGGGRAAVLSTYKYLQGRAESEGQE